MMWRRGIGLVMSKSRGMSWSCEKADQQELFRASKSKQLTVIASQHFHIVSHSSILGTPNGFTAIALGALRDAAEEGKKNGVFSSK